MPLPLLASLLAAEPAPGLSLTFDELAVVGEVSVESVAETLKGRGEAFGACLLGFGQAQAVRVRARLHPDGGVDPAAARVGYPEDDPRRSCVLGALTATRFPVGGAEIAFVLRGLPTSTSGVRASVKPGAAPPVGPVEAEGVLDKSAVDAGVRRGLPGVRACYQKELGRDPTLAGSVEVRFRVGADGGVELAEITASSLRRVTVEACILSRFLALRFPASTDADGLIASYPLDFAPPSAP